MARITTSTTASLADSLAALLPPLRWSLLLIACLLAAPSVAAAQSNATGQFDLTSFAEPYVLLLRDPVVHQELDLSERQRQQILQQCYAMDPAFWKLRGGTREQALAGLRTMAEKLREGIEPLLTAAQQRRLTQIQLQLAGFRAFLRPQVIEALSITAEQQNGIEQAIDVFEQGYQALQDRFRKGEAPEKLQPEIKKLRSTLRTTVVGVFSNEQKRKWQTLIGDAVDATKLGRVKFKAPPIDAESPWLNGQPLTDADLRGHVVALHFYAFQCINCKRNQPWYKQWHQELADDGLIVLGIHTPEVANERDIERVEANAAEAGLDYPIVIDNDKTHWRAWGNTMWPTTYLIDKQGFVRYWWMGELNWKDAGMQETFKTHIEKLLAEG